MANRRRIKYDLTFEVLPDKRKYKTPPNEITTDAVIFTVIFGAGSGRETTTTAHGKSNVAELIQGARTTFVDGAKKGALPVPAI